MAAIDQVRGILVRIGAKREEGVGPQASGAAVRAVAAELAAVVVQLREELLSEAGVEPTATQPSAEC